MNSKCSVDSIGKHFGRNNSSRKESKLVAAAGREKDDLDPAEQLKGKIEAPKYENDWTVKNVKNIIFMVDVPISRPVAARRDEMECIRWVEDWIRKMTRKNAENEEKTGRIEAKRATITSRNGYLVLGATFPRYSS